MKILIFLMVALLSLSTLAEEEQRPYRATLNPEPKSQDSSEKKDVKREPASDEEQEELDIKIHLNSVQGARPDSF